MSRRYSSKVIELFTNPVNVGEIEDADGKAVEGSIACGDMISLTLKVNEKTGIIEDIKFKSYGCASNIATASMITIIAKGKTIEEAKQLSIKDIDKALGGLPPVKMHCAVLAIDGLKAAIQNYEERHGLIKNLEINESFVRRRLRKVMHPWYGKDILTLKIVRDFKIKNNVITVTIKFLNEEDQFKEYIVDEIEEKLGNLPNFKLVIEQLDWFRELFSFLNQRYEKFEPKGLFIESLK